jgi:hypothetical protein
MRYVLALLATLAWGLWFGGMVALFLFVSHLFVNDRATAIVAAPKMFLVFERFQFFVATLAIVSAALWRLVDKRRTITLLFVFFAMSAVGTIASATLIRAPMEKLRLEGQTSAPQFQRLHKASEKLYTMQAVLLLVGGIMLPSALRIPPRPGTETEVEPRTAPPV